MENTKGKENEVQPTNELLKYLRIDGRLAKYKKHVGEATNRDEGIGAVPEVDPVQASLMKKVQSKQAGPSAPQGKGSTPTPGTTTGG